MFVPEWEDPEHWEAHHHDTIESLAPEGHLEHMLAERVAICLWKLRRLEFVYMGEVVNNMNSVPRHLAFLKMLDNGRVTNADAPFPELTQAEVDLETSRRLLPNSLVLPALTRYEAHLHRICMQSLHELEARQERRQGRPSPLARYDVSRSPSDLVE